MRRKSNISVEILKFEASSYFADADKMNVKFEFDNYYTKHSPNPALDFIERAANALEGSVAELLRSQTNTAKAKPGPTFQLQRKFEQVKLLPKNRTSSFSFSTRF